MSSPQSSAHDSPPEAPVGGRTYALVVVVEIAVLAGLYWLGRHFG